MSTRGKLKGKKYHKRKANGRNSDRGTEAGRKVIAGDITVVSGAQSRKVRCPVISVNPRRGGRPENIHIDL